MKRINPIEVCLQACADWGLIPTEFRQCMTWEEQVLWLSRFLNTVVLPKMNETIETTNEMQEAFEALHDYVENYFENLDVQDEVDHKIDEMAESGELAEIIAQFLGLHSVYGFDKIADMAASAYLSEGSICKVLGKTNPMTGDGSYYRVRQLINTDEPDGVNLVLLTETLNLVAEIIPDYNANVLDNKIDGVEATLNGRIDGVSAQLLSKLSNAYQDPAYMHAFGVLNAKIDGNTYTMGGMSTTFNSDRSMKNIYVITYCDSASNNRLYNITCGGTANPSLWSYTYIDISYANAGGQLHGSSSCAVGNYFYIADLPNANHSILKVDMTNSSTEYIDLTSFGITKIAGCQWDGETQQWLVKVNDTNTGMSTNYVFNEDF